MASRKPTLCSSSTALRVGATAVTSRPALTQPAINLLQCGRFAGPGSAAQIDSEITRVEYLLDSALLFVAQMLGGPKLMCAAQPPASVDAVIHHSNHALFAIEAFVCG